MYFFHYYRSNLANLLYLYSLVIRMYKYERSPKKIKMKD